MTTITRPVALNTLQEVYGGTAPVSVNEYYRGTPQVPGVLQSAVAVPTAGTDSLNAYITTGGASTAQAAAQYVWQNIARLARGTIDDFTAPVTGWPGYTFRINTSYGSNISSQTARANYDNAALVTPDTTSTVLVIAADTNPNIQEVLVNGTTVSALFGPTQFAPSGSNCSTGVYQLNTPITNVRTVEMTWTRNNTDAGSWPIFLVLPGTWGLISAKPTVSVGDSMAVGDIDIILRNGGDGSALVSNLGAPSLLNWTSWWYSSYGMQVNVNAADAPVSYTTAVNYTALKFRKR